MNNRKYFKKLLTLLAHGELIIDDNRIFARFFHNNHFLLFKIFFDRGRVYLAPSPDSDKRALVDFIVETYFTLDTFLDPDFKYQDTYQLATSIINEIESFKYIYLV